MSLHTSYKKQSFLGNFLKMQNHSSATLHNLSYVTWSFFALLKKCTNQISAIKWALVAQYCCYKLHNLPRHKPSTSILAFRTLNLIWHIVTIWTMLRKNPFFERLTSFWQNQVGISFNIGAVPWIVWAHIKDNVW